MTAAIPPLPHSNAATLDVLNALPCGVVIIDRDRRVRAINDAFRRNLKVIDSQWMQRCAGGSLECRESRPVTSGPRPVGPRCPVCDLRTLASRALDDDRPVKGAVKLETGQEGRGGRVMLDLTAVPLRLGGDHLAVLVVNRMQQLDDDRSPPSHGHSHGIVGSDPALLDMLELVRQVAVLNVPVLIQGESGTGKELVAHALHRLSDRSRGLMVPVNCGALPDGLLESELFGHVKGAFTGAVRDKKGRFELADGGTIFLDEIGELSMAMQVKFLRVLQNGAFERVGGERTITVDARLVCATNRDLAADVEAGRFRADLFFRLCVVPITVPSLRERPSDIVPLAEHFLHQARAGSGTGEHGIELSPEAAVALRAHAWPGNVRELENAIRFAVIRARDGVVRAADLPPSVVGRAAPRGSRSQPSGRTELTVSRVREALVETEGNRSRAARLLGISRATLYRFLDANRDRI
jgi:transcriptional regulator with GAF, ATPase, and Fis domain